MVNAEGKLEEFNKIRASFPQDQGPT